MQNYDEFKIDLYSTLTYILKCLPGVAPNKTKKLFEGLYNEYIDCIVSGEQFKGEINGHRISNRELSEIWISVDGMFGKEIVKISPKGAEVLRDLYISEALFMRSGQKVNYQGELDDYIFRELKFLKAYENYKSYWNRYDYLIAHPEDIKYIDFSYSLLNELFTKKYGLTQGEHSLTLDGYEVLKSVTGYKSNSGKSTDYEVVIYWVDKTGKRHEIRKESNYKSNRRNDANRNYGLPE